MSTSTTAEGSIRKPMIEADLVDCMVALPGQLFYNTAIPVCLWFLARNKGDGRGLEGRPLRDRRGETLFIDARALGTMTDRTHRTLMQADIDRVAGAYHAWRGDPEDQGSVYADEPGLCKSVPTSEIAAQDYVLTPGRYVGLAEQEADGEPFEDKMERLVADLETQFAEGARLEAQIRDNLRRLGYGR
jgi:type I restriction enzyme M protein